MRLLTNLYLATIVFPERLRGAWWALLLRVLGRVQVQGNNMRIGRGTSIHVLKSFESKVEVCFYCKNFINILVKDQQFPARISLKGWNK